MRIDPPTPDAANGIASEQPTGYKALLMVCTGTQCATQGAYSIRDALRRELTARELEKNFLVMGIGCAGFCDQGPLILTQPEGIFYQQLKKRDIPRIIEDHLIGGEPVADLMAHNFLSPTRFSTHTPPRVFSKQRLMALRNMGLIDPRRIESYLEWGGYTALPLALGKMKPEDILAEVKESELRDPSLPKGGSIGDTWEACLLSSQKTGEPPVIVCHVVEDQSLDLIDRSIVEIDPHTVIEGICIGGYALGATKGIIVIDQKYTVARSRLEKALDEARQGGHLGPEILGTKFSFDIALQDRLADEEATTNKPDATERPTLPDNAETWANLPIVIRKGGTWYAHIGTGRFSKNVQKAPSNSKVIALEGKVRNAGLMEVPNRITLQELIDNVGGGIPGSRLFKAAQVGGPSGTLLPAVFLDKQLDFDMVIPAGASAKLGAVTVFDTHTCMVDIARQAMKASQDESCGKCVPCREGTMVLGQILDNICRGTGQRADLVELERVAQFMELTSACQVGVSAAQPVLSTLRHFRNEYTAHTDASRCVGGICKQLITYTITDACTGCVICRKRCPADAIFGEKKQVHVIDQNTCTKCGRCLDVCKFDAVHVE